jgi:pimeloyl-ACP methyl ester carboxylesterase
MVHGLITAGAVMPHLVTTLIHRGVQTWAERTRARHPAYLEVDSPLPRWPQDRFVQAGDQHLQLLEWQGDGPPLVLLHGLNNTAWIWARTATIMAASGRRVVAPTQRGHGQSSKPLTGYRLEATSTDLEAVLDALALERVDLAGHSWGGKVAMHFAATRHQRVRSLILADPAPPRGVSRLLAHKRLIHDAFRPERGPFADQATLEAQMKLLLQHQVGDETDRTAWAACFSRQADGSYHAALAEAAFDEIVTDAVQADIEPLLGAITCPVLLMLPQLSLSTPGRAWSRARKLWPQLDERRMVGDHTFVHTNPRDTARAMLGFLERAGRAGRPETV